MLSFNEEKPLILMIVPTGIGASVGGYAGDASLRARRFAKDYNVIVNPNIVNAACFSGITDNMLYVEGWTISQFLKGNINLIPSNNNKIGIIFDRGMSEGIINVHINTMNAVKTVYGADIIGYEITDKPCEVKFFNTPNGISTGGVFNNETLVKAGKKLIERGAQTIAVVCKFEEPPEDNYQNGEGVDIVGGVEAVISHYLTRELQVPVVHSPAFEDITICKEIVDSKASAEYITPTFLPCILLGLINAPLFSSKKREYYISKDKLKAIIMPYNSLGSSVVLDALKNKIPIIAVKENKTILNITKDIIKKNDIIETDTYIKCNELLKGLINE